MKYRGFEITMEENDKFPTGVLITVTFPAEYLISGHPIKGDYCTSDRMFLIDQFIDEYEELDEILLSK